MLSTGKRDQLTVYQSVQCNIPEDLNLHSFYSQLLMSKVMTLAVVAQFHVGQRGVYNQRPTYSG